ncbi:MAG: Asp-tRNA(Asn)/Glu-tRNA(Gln) amidotransferase subunit GatC [Pseudomonadota bacterium]
MSITSDDINKLAVLSRLQFEQDELGDITEKLGNIVDFVDQLQAAATEDVMPMAHPHDQVQPLRDDIADPDIDRDALQASASETAEGLYLVPRVIE